MLADIEAVLSDQELSRPVRLPVDLAQAAVRAWRRDEVTLLGEELPEERLLRERAGTLALIGLAVDQRSTRDGDQVLVNLDPSVTADLADDDLDAAILRGDFVPVDRLTLVSRVGWIELEQPTFVRAGERYRVDWESRSVTVAGPDGAERTYRANPSGPDSIR